MKNILILGIILMSILFPSIRVSAIEFETAELFADGQSTYMLSMNLDNTTWERGKTFTFNQRITVHEFGNNIRDFHEIVLWYRLYDAQQIKQSFLYQNKK